MTDGLHWSPCADDLIETTTLTGFVPVVLKGVWTPDEHMIRVAQRLADEALARHDDPCDGTATTNLHGLYACERAVERHQDLQGAEPGMRVHGLVVRSDGHRLHSQRLTASGHSEGLLLEAGDFYEIDPYDPHWTTLERPGGPDQLIFFVEGDMPDDRSRQEVAQDLADLLYEDLHALQA